MTHDDKYAAVAAAGFTLKAIGSSIRHGFYETGTVT